MMLRTTAKALAASAALMAPPVAARAQTQPSDLSVGVAMVQWAMLYCDSKIIPPEGFSMIQTIMPLLPKSELDFGFSYVDSSLEEIYGNDTASSCAFLSVHLAKIGN